MLRTVCVALLTLLTCSVRAGDEQPRTDQALSKLDIRPKKDAPWNADLDDVKKVLHAAAGELWKSFPGRQLPPILVEPKGGPITLFDRGPNGEIRVRLDTGGTLWAQYTYQFSHEFGHVLCDCKEQPHRQKWFEESLCELASLYVLRRSAETWTTQPPYPNWKNYASSLKSYADDLLKKSQLPAGKTLVQWYAENADALIKNSCDRPRNSVVAAQMLPLFEKTPEHWAAVGYLNTEKLDMSFTFPQYLEAWHRHCPAKHRAFVREIASKFGIEIKPITDERPAAPAK